MVPTMKITRVYTSSDGETHFGEYSFAPSSTHSSIEGMTVFERAFDMNINAGQVMYRSCPGVDANDAHCAPFRQFVAVMGGTIKIIVSDGESRTFGPGEFFLVEDTTGKGHASYSVDRVAFYIPILGEV